MTIAHNILSRRGKGCLAGKTEEQKEEFFRSLAGFAKTDLEFFRLQVEDLKPKEREEFARWVAKDNEMLTGMLSIIGVIKKLLKAKHENNTEHRD